MAINIGGHKFSSSSNQGDKSQSNKASAGINQGILFNPQGAAKAAGIDIGGNTADGFVRQGDNGQPNMAFAGINQAMVFNLPPKPNINITFVSPPPPPPPPVPVPPPPPPPPPVPVPPPPPPPVPVPPPIPVSPPTPVPPPPPPPPGDFPCVNEYGQSVGINILLYDKHTVSVPGDGRFFNKDQLLNCLVKDGYNGFPLNSGQLAVQYMNQGRLQVIPTDPDTKLPILGREPDPAVEGVDYQFV